MAKNQFTLNSLIKDVQRDIDKGKKLKLRKAGAFFRRKLKQKIKALGLVDEGNLLKGVADNALENAIIVGVGAPGYHALMVEYGTDERTTLGKGEERKEIRSTGRMPATPFFLNTLEENIPEIVNIMSEEWI